MRPCREEVTRMFTVFFYHMFTNSYGLTVKLYLQKLLNKATSLKDPIKMIHVSLIIHDSEQFLFRQYYSNLLLSPSFLFIVLITIFLIS